MAKYTDVYLLPIPEKNLAAYREMAAKAGEIFRKHGAVSYREYAASDLNVTENMVSFPKVIELQANETLIYAAVEFESEMQRNQSMKLIFDDSEMRSLMSGKPLFDYKRMVCGGFEILVEI